MEVHADHHAFALGSPDADTTTPTASGSVLECGSDFVRVLTGIANGPVKVVVHERLPVVDTEDWEVVEECELRVGESVEWMVAAHDGTLPPLTDLASGTYGVRVAARGRDAGWDRTVTEPSEDYRFEIWPASDPVPFRRIRKVDSVWPYESDERELDQDADAGNDASLAIKATLAIRETKYGRKVVRVFDLDDPADAPGEWGGRSPSTALREIAPGTFRNAAQALAAIDRDLLDLIVEADDDTQRVIARWSARRAYTRAGVAELEWVSPALDALDHGTELPPPFDNGGDLWTRFEQDPSVSRTFVQHYAGGEPHLPWTFAMGAADSAQLSDPLEAALSTFMAAVMTYSTEYNDFLLDARQAFFDTSG